MTNKISGGLKKISILTLSIIIIFILFSQISLAIDENTEDNANLSPGNSLIIKTRGVANQAGYDPATGPYSLRENISSIIQLVLSFIGIIFLVLIIISGIQWMSAGGNEETIEKSKNRIKNATIGLAVILFAYAITIFITTILIEKTNFKN